MAHYPVDGISWADRLSTPSLDEAMRSYSGVLMGGIDHQNDFNYRPWPVLDQQISESLTAGGTERFILAPGCVLPTQCPAETLDYVMMLARSHSR